MEWERAKTYILMFFLALNLALGGLLLLEGRRYTVTPEQEHIIRSILNQNNISMYAPIIRRFPPMGTIYIGGFYYDANTLIDIFFEDPSVVVTTYGQTNQEFEDQSSRLMITPGGFVEFRTDQGLNNFTNIYGLPGEELEYARLLTDAFIDKHFPNFAKDGMFAVPSGLRIIYRQIYRGHLIQTNHIEFLVTDIGIQQVEMRFGQVLGYSGTSRAIFSPDEALLTFIQRARNIFDAPIMITGMDLVYYQEYGSPLPGEIYWAVPHYRVFIDGNNMPFLINAYTNEIRH